MKKYVAESLTQHVMENTGPGSVYTFDPYDFVKYMITEYDEDEIRPEDVEDILKGYIITNNITPNPINDSFMDRLIGYLTLHGVIKNYD